MKSVTENEQLDDEVRKYLGAHRPQSPTTGLIDSSSSDHPDRKDLLGHNHHHHLLSSDLSNDTFRKSNDHHSNINTIMHGFLPYGRSAPSNTVHNTPSSYFNTAAPLLPSDRNHLILGPSPGMFQQATTVGRKRKTDPSDDEESLAQRRLSHKEVERRRREAINKGINDLASIVPNCEKVKNSVLTRAVEYIQELQALQQQYYALERHHEALQKECQRAWAEVEIWKKSAQKNNNDN